MREITVSEALKHVDVAELQRTLRGDYQSRRDRVRRIVKDQETLGGA